MGFSTATKKTFCSTNGCSINKPRIKTKFIHCTNRMFIALAKVRITNNKSMAIKSPSPRPQNPISSWKPSVMLKINMTAKHYRPCSSMCGQAGDTMSIKLCDRGYRGQKKVGDTDIILPGTPLKRDNRYQRDKKRKRCRRRAAIEPIIGHLKTDFRLTRNFLKGIAGDTINLLLAACAWNLAKWLRHAFLSLFSWLTVMETMHNLRQSTDGKKNTLRWVNFMSNRTQSGIVFQG